MAYEGISLGLNIDFTQMEKARNATNNLYKAIGQVDKKMSGIHMPSGIPNEINHLSTVTLSYVRRLESEGKQYEANKAAIGAYRDAVEKLTSKQRSLEVELGKIAEKTGTSSKAYRDQQVRINEAATQTNKYKRTIEQLSGEMQRLKPPTVFDKLKGKFSEAQKDAEHTKGMFKSMFAANIATNAVSAGFSKIKDGIKSAFAAGKEYNEQQQTMNATWLTLTGSASKGSAMVKQINDMALAAQNSSEMVDGLSQKFYAINKSASQTGRLTKDVLTLQDAFGKSDDAVMNFGTQFSQMMANQKVSAQDMMSFVNVFPEYRSQLLKTVNQQKGTKLSMKQLNDEMSKGKISSKTAITALDTLAKGYKNATGNFGATIPGMRRVLQANGKRIIGELEKPFENMKSPVAKAASKWIADKSTMNRFSRLGNTWASGLNNAMSKAFGGSSAAKKTTQFLDKALDTLNSKSKVFFSWLGNHAKDLKDIGKDIFTITSTIGKSVWKTFAGIAINIGKAFGLISKNAKGDAIHQLAQGLNNISKNKLAMKLIADSIVAIAAAKGLKTVGGSLFDIGSKAVGAAKNTSALIKGLRGVKNIEGLSKTAKKFHNIGSGIRNATKNMSAFIKGLRGVKNVEGLSETAKKFNSVGSGLVGKGEGAGLLNGVLQSMASANKANGAKGLAKFNPISGYKNLTTAGKVTTGLAGAAVLADAGGQVFQGIKDIHNADKRSKDFGGAAGTVAGGAIGMAVGGPIGAAIGSQIGKQLGTAGGEAVNKFTKGWQSKKPPKKFWSLENMGYSAHNMWNGMTKGIGGAINAIKKKWQGIKKWFSNLFKGVVKFVKNPWKGLSGFFGGIVKVVKGKWKGISSWFGKLGRGAAKAFKNVWNGITGFFGKIIKGIKNIWKGISSWFGKLGHGAANAFKNVWKGISGFFGGVVKGVKGVWNGTTKFFSGVGHGMVNGIKSAWSGIVGFFQGIWDKVKDIVKPIGDAVNGVKNGAVSAWNNLTGGGKKKAHAKGGAITQGHTALVGEGGPELAYKPNASQVRLLGENGPAFTKVHPGEHILNARDTRKVMRGGLGRGTVLKGYAQGTTALKKASGVPAKSANSSNDLGSLSKSSKTAWTEVSATTSKLSSKTKRTGVNNFKSLTKQVKTQTNKLKRNTNSDFKTTTKDANRQTDKIRKESISDYTSMRKGVTRQMEKLEDAVIDLAKSTAKGFGNALDKMKSYARDAMSATIDQLNKGISGIDQVLSQFGGNAQVIKPIKFATGTDSNGRLTHNTLAMVNDAQSGPRQEALVSDKNEVFYPRGNNVTMMIPKGWGVLNGHQTQKIQQAQQGIQHFAKGSGIDEDKLIKIAEAGQKDPAKDFKNSFLSNVKPSGPDLKKATISMAGNGANQYGVPWNNAMWSVINDAIGGGADGKGGTREAFLKYAEKTFSGVPYAMGAMSKAATDCSGMVAQALSHFGINIGRSTVDMQTSKGVTSLGHDISKTQPGDIVVFGHGTGASGHVGIISNPRKHMMFNANGGYGKALVSSIDESKSMGYEYFRVKGLHDAANSKDTAKLKDDNRLKALAKKQLGAKAIKWIEDNLGDSGDLGGNPGGEGVERWRGTVKKVLRMLDLSTSKSMVDRVLRQINTESSGNPRAKQAGADPDGDGSGPAMGLMQTKRSTFDAYKRSPNSDIFNGPDSIYAGLNYAKHKYGPTLYYLGQGHGYAKGGRPPIGEPVLVGEQGPEIVKFNHSAEIIPHEKSRQKMKSLGNLIGDSIDGKRGATKVSNSKLISKITPSAPEINITINGDIRDKKDVDNFTGKVRQIVEEAMTKQFTMIGNAFGADESVF